MAAVKSASSPSVTTTQAGRLFGALLGCVLSYALTSRLPRLPSAVVASLLLAGASLLCGRRHLSPMALWSLIGTAGGSLLGLAVVLVHSLREIDPRGDVGQRSLILLAPALAGVVAGLRLSGDADTASRRHPRDVLRSASALTSGLFAILVTITFLHSGLDVARTFSSRLSCSLTILVASAAVPGWLAHLLRAPRPADGPG